MRCVAYSCTTSSSSSRKKPGVAFHRFPANPKLRKAWIDAVKRKDWQPSKHSCLCSEHFTEDQIDRTSLSSIRLRENAIPTEFNFPANIKKILDETKSKPSHKKRKKSKFDNGESLLSSEDSFTNIVNNIKVEQDSILNTSEKSHINKPWLPGHSSTTVSPIISSVSSMLENVEHVPSSLLHELSKHNLSIKKTVETKDASTSPIKEDCDPEELKRLLYNSDMLIDNYRKKIKILGQRSRRYKTRLTNMKHNIFSELQKRQYLSSDSNFKEEEEDGCLLDRNSIRLRHSSESDFDEDI